MKTSTWVRKRLRFQRRESLSSKQPQKAGPEATGAKKKKGGPGLRGEIWNRLRDSAQRCYKWKAGVVPAEKKKADADIQDLLLTALV